MPGWDSYRAVYGAELRAAARELTDHGWTVVEESATTLRVVTGSVVDVVEVPAGLGRAVCARLRAVGVVVPVAGTPTGTWWYPVAAGAELPPELAASADVVLHSGGASVLAPPSQLPDGWVHWRVAPALTGFRLPAPELVLPAVVASLRWRTDPDRHPGAQRPVAAVAAGTRSW